MEVQEIFFFHVDALNRGVVLLFGHVQLSFLEHSLHFRNVNARENIVIHIVFKILEQKLVGFPDFSRMYAKVEAHTVIPGTLPWHTGGRHLFNFGEWGVDQIILLRIIEANGAAVRMDLLQLHI